MQHRTNIFILFPHRV